MYRAKITKDISRQEMLSLREQGMSNAEIAEACGCSRSTVFNYIGGGTRSRQQVTVYNSNNKQEEVKEAMEERRPDCMVLSERFKAKVGETIFDVNIDRENDRIDISASSDSILVAASVSEVEALYKVIGNVMSRI